MAKRLVTAAKGEIVAEVVRESFEYHAGYGLDVTILDCVDLVDGQGFRALLHEIEWVPESDVPVFLELVNVRRSLNSALEDIREVKRLLGVA